MVGLVSGLEEWDFCDVHVCGNFKVYMYVQGVVRV